MIPLTPPVKKRIVTSPYGWRTLKGKRQFHDGIDYVSKLDERVYAVCAGKIVLDFDKYDPRKRWIDKRHSAGNYIILQAEIDGEIYYFRYIHLGKNYVSHGDVVSQNDCLGEYANAGMSYGAHLHFDMYDKDWKKIDPTGFLIEGFKLSGVK